MVAGARDAHERLGEILDDAMRVDEARWGKIRLLNATARSLQIAVQRGFGDNFLKVFQSVDVDDNVPAVRALALRRRVSVANLAEDLCSERYRAIANEAGFRAMQTTPMIAADGRLLGTLSTCFDRAYLPSISEGLVFDHCASRAVNLVQALLQPI
jgi:hypothetical protein